MDKNFYGEFSRFARQHGFVPANSPMSSLRNLNRHPDVIVDVGVRYGTPWLYSVCSESKFLLVDPQKGGEALLRHKPCNFEFVNKALGSESGVLVLHEQGAKSTLLERTRLTREDTLESYEVEVLTLDQLLAEYAPQGTLGLKLDTEGYELEVVKGLSKDNVSRIEFLIAEVSVLDRFEGSYNFSELVAFLNEIGLRFYNVMTSVGPRPRRFLDCIFLQEDDAAFSGL